MTIVDNPWLEEQDYKIRIKEIPWEGYHRASLISSEDLSLLQVMSSQSKSKREQVWTEETEAYLALYLRLLSELGRVDCLQAVVVYLSDMLDEHEERVEVVLRLTGSSPFTLHTSFGRHLESSDAYLRSKTLSILSILLGSCPAPSTKILSPALQSIHQFMNSDDSNQRDLATECLQSILRQAASRRVVWTLSNPETPGGDDFTQCDLIPSLVDLLKVGSQMNAQMQYRTALCFWLLTFDVEIAHQINKRYAVIRLLIDLARNAVKEKVTRVLVATLRNLAHKAPEANLGIMLVAGNLLPLVQSFSVRKWSDDELKEDIFWLKEKLEEAKQKMTTYDEYSTELESGILRWSPPHTSDEFWSQNAEKLNSKDYQQLRILIRLLSEASDPVILAVAANDISKYVKYCETGKRSAEKLGAKTSVMNLISHQDADVKYWALVSVQQLISQPWAR